MIEMEQKESGQPSNATIRGFLGEMRIKLAAEGDATTCLSSQTISL